MDNNINFIQKNYPGGGFLQSEEWQKFQEIVGHRTFNISYPHPSPLPQAGEGEICFWANIIEHKLPIVGRYFYAPRGPIYNLQFTIYNKFSIFNDQIKKIIDLAKENNTGWVRIDPADEEALELIKKNIESFRPRRTGLKIQKAPHDMQPREILVMDITKSEEEILAEMKAKTRYNIKLAEKRDVKISNFKCQMSNQIPNPNDKIKKYINEFIRLTKIMAKRQGISAHADDYYRKMLEVIPGDILKLYIAEYENKVVAANLVVFFGKTCTYLHGASDDKYRNVMAPYLLQWRQIQDAKKAGCERYDMGGIKTCNIKHETCNKNSWEGITRFKLGFAPNIRPVEFPGSYDIIVSPTRYWIYRIMQRFKSLIK